MMTTFSFLGELSKGWQPGCQEIYYVTQRKMYSLII